MHVRFLLLLFLLNPCLSGAQVYEVRSGNVDFHSKAPQELIQASSPGLKGFLDVKKRMFAFKLDIVSFAGFNSPLQREHFNENYMESTIFPQAYYSGKIIEDVDIAKDGTYTVRTKGKLKIHGIEQERIINSVIETRNGKISIKSDFIVTLADHSIKIPRIVYDKLAPEINVSVGATLVPKN